MMTFDGQTMYGHVHPVMDSKIVYGPFDGLPVLELFYVFYHQICFKSVRMVVIQQFPFFKRYIVMTLVIKIMA